MKRKHMKRTLFWMGILLGVVITCGAALAAPAAEVHVGNVTLQDGQSTTQFGGVASFSGGVLALNGVTVPASQCYVSGGTRYGLYVNGDVTIELTGSNSFTAADTVGFGMSYGVSIRYGDVTIIGPGSLTATAGKGFVSDGFHIDAGSLTLQSGSVVAKGGVGTWFSRGVCAYMEQTAQGDVGGNITINGGSLRGEGVNASTSMGVAAGVTITLNAGELYGVTDTSTANNYVYGVYGEQAIRFNGGAMTAASTQQYSSATNDVLDFGTSGDWYKWKASDASSEPSGDFTPYKQQAYVYDWQHRYLQMRPLTSDVPPRITQQPQDASVLTGQSAQFSIAAVGNSVTYQWYVRRGSAGWQSLTGATSQQYALSGAALADDGCQYRCAVTDAFGHVTYSNAATLRVSSIAKPPQTGDAASPLGWLAGLALAAGGLLLMCTRTRRGRSTR